MNKIKLKESLCILEETEDVYQVLFTATRRIKKFKVDNLVKEIISRLKSEQVELEFVDELSNNYDVEDVISCLHSLEYQGIIRRYTEGKNHERHCHNFD